MSTSSIAVCPFVKLHTRLKRVGEHNTPRKAPPGPSGLPLVGVLPFMSGDGLATITALARKYGDAVQYRAFGVPICFLNHPAYVEEVLVNQHDKFIKGPGVQANAIFFGRGLLTNGGEVLAASASHRAARIQPEKHPAVSFGDRGTDGKDARRLAPRRDDRHFQELRGPKPVHYGACSVRRRDRR